MDLSNQQKTAIQELVELCKKHHINIYANVRNGNAVIEIALNHYESIECVAIEGMIYSCAGIKYPKLYKGINI